MTTAMSLGLLFIAKMADNALSTVKTIMIQRNRSLLAGVAITLSSFLYFWITRKRLCCGLPGGSDYRPCLHYIQRICSIAAGG